MYISGQGARMPSTNVFGPMLLPRCAEEWGKYLMEVVRTAEGERLRWNPNCSRYVGPARSQLSQVRRPATQSRKKCFAALPPEISIATILLTTRTNQYDCLTCSNQY